MAKLGGGRRFGTRRERKMRGVAWQLCSLVALWSRPRAPKNQARRPRRRPPRVNSSGRQDSLRIAGSSEGQRLAPVSWPDRRQQIDRAGHSHALARQRTATGLAIAAGHRLWLAHRGGRAVVSVRPHGDQARLRAENERASRCGRSTIRPTFEILRLRQRPAQLAGGR